MVGPAPVSIVARNAVSTPAHAPLDLEALRGEEIRQPARGLDLLEAELGVGVNPVRERFELVARAHRRHRRAAS